MKSETQIDFSGGLNLFVDRYRLGDDEYGKAYNIRIRDGSPTCINEPVEEARLYTMEVNGHTQYINIPGPIQGIYGFEQYSLCFACGGAYYKNISATYWTKVANLNLSKKADYVYVQAVPASPASYGVKLKEDGVINGNSSDSGVVTTTSLVINGTPSGIVIQDGISQPYFMWLDGSTLMVKQLQKYDDWTTEYREYVPIGKQMAVMNGILFIAASDGKTFYRSVSGRYLDFVVNVDMYGNKGGDATTTSYAVSANPITALIPMKSGLLLVGTSDVCYPIELNWNKLIFGEPTFINNKSFNAGIVSQFCFAELLNDYSFIDLDGLRSYNALSALNNEGRDSVFSAKIGKLFDGIIQVSGYCCAAVINNYAYYACNTTVGYAVLVYDLTTEKWVSIDYYVGLGAIKMLAVVNESISPVLFAVTSDTIYRLFAGDPLEAYMELKIYTPQDAKVEYKLDNFRPVFDRNTDALDIAVTEVTDDAENKTLYKTIEHTPSGITYPASYPLYWNKNSSVENERFNFKGLSRIGYKVGVNLTWTGEAKLMQCQYDFDTVAKGTSTKQQASV